jgi:uncharacterized membrane protein
MSRAKNVRWLYGEIPGLVERGVLDAAASERLHLHYGPRAKHRPRALALLIFGVLGAGLVGLGIVLILANNWDNFSRTLRAGITFGLLLSAQGLAAYTLWRRPTSRAWNESAALFLGLCIGAAIALIGQTYNIPGDLGSFLLTWMLLIFPLMYLMDAGVVAIGYLAGITGWSAYVQVEGQNALWFWPMAAAAAPYLTMTVRKHPRGVRSIWLMWAICLCAIVAPGFVIERALPGVWIPLYASLLTVLYLGGVFWFDEDRGAWQQPFRSTGAMGLAILTLSLTFQTPWDHVGWKHYHTEAGYDSLSAIGDYVLTGALFFWALALLIATVRRRRLAQVPFGIAPILAAAGFVVAAGADDPLLPWVLFNIYVFMVGLGTIVRGVRADEMRVVNEGMLFLAGLIIVRFFDSDLSFVARGIAFIVIGLGFLASNLAMVARKKKGAI